MRRRSHPIVLVGRQPHDRAALVVLALAEERGRLAVERPEPLEPLADLVVRGAERRLVARRALLAALHPGIVGRRPARETRRSYPVLAMASIDQLVDEVE